MPRGGSKPIGPNPMTQAELDARYRAGKRQVNVLAPKEFKSEWIALLRRVAAWLCGGSGRKEQIERFLDDSEDSH